MTYMVMNHRAKVDRAYIEYEVTVDTAPGVTPVKPYWLDVENCQSDPVYDVPGGAERGATHRRSFAWNVPEAGRIVAGGGHVHGGGQNLTLRRPDCSDDHVYTSRPVWGGPRHPFYNVRPVLHEPGPIHMTGFRSARGVPVAAGERVVLDSNYDASPAAHARDGHLHRLPRPRLVGHVEVRRRPARLRGAGEAGGPQEAAAVHGPDRRPPERQGGQHRRAARPARRARKRGTISVGDLFFKRPNVSVRAGSTLTWLFGGDTLHNVTLANGPRGFSSPNLSDGRTYSQRLKVPGTYQLFCGLHPVDMTATVKVKRRAR